MDTEKLIGDINKDFTVVGKHRVHSWYAWAIVGIVFGMALGVVYVANRSAEFEASQAAFFAPNQATPVSTAVQILEIVSDGTEKFTITALPVRSAYDRDMEETVYFVINPADGKKVEFSKNTKTVVVGNKDFTINWNALRAVAARPIEGRASTMPKPQGANDPFNGTKWISVRNTSRTGNKIVAGQTIQFTKNVQISGGTVSYAMLSFEATNLPMKILVNGQEAFSNSAKTRQLNTVDVARYLKPGNNVFLFELVQPTGAANNEGPFGLNYTLSIILNAPATPIASLERRAETIVVKPSVSNGAFSSGTNSKLAGFTITNSAAAEITIGKLILHKAASGIQLGDLFVTVNGVRFGEPMPVVTDGEAVLGFNGTPITLGRGRSATVEAFAKVKSSSPANIHESLFDLEVFYLVVGGDQTVINLLPVVPGQNVVILMPPPAPNPTPTEPIALKLTASPVALSAVTKLFAGVDNVELARIKLAADSAGDIVVRSITFTDTITGAAIGDSFSNYGLWEGSQRLATLAAAPAVGATDIRLPFKFDKEFVLGKNKNRTLILRASVSATPAINSNHTFNVANVSDIDAIGKNGEQVTVLGGAGGQALKIDGILVSLIGSASLPTANHVRKDQDEVANLTLRGSALASVKLQNLTFTFSGGAIGNNFSVNLKSASGATFGKAVWQVCAPNESFTCSVTFAPDITLARSQALGFKVIVNSSDFNNSANTAETLNVSIAKPADIGLSGGAATSLTGPLTVATISYQ